MIAMPNRLGWVVSWYTGEDVLVRSRNGNVKHIKLTDSFEHVSKDKVIKKKQELESQGYEIAMFTECIF